MPRATKITLDFLNEEQWQKVQRYLQSEPNKQRIINDKSYGLYVQIFARPEVEIDIWTGEKKSLVYKEVTFLFPDIDHFHPGEDSADRLGYWKKRGEERKQVKQGLAKLLEELLEG